jgi:transmembrane secretion effector
MGVFQDLEAENRYLETFIVRSWAEHQRQHERFTHADREFEERLHSYTRAQPRVRHLVAAT